MTHEQENIELKRLLIQLCSGAIQNGGFVSPDLAREVLASVAPVRTRRGGKAA